MIPKPAALSTAVEQPCFFTWLQSILHLFSASSVTSLQITRSELRFVLTKGKSRYSIPSFEQWILLRHQRWTASMWQTICPTRTSSISPHHSCVLCDVLQCLRLFSITEMEPLEICYDRSLEKDIHWQRKEPGPFSCHQMGKISVYLWL